MDGMQGVIMKIKKLKGYINCNQFAHNIYVSGMKNTSIYDAMKESEKHHDFSRFKIILECNEQEFCDLLSDPRFKIKLQEKNNV